MAMQRYEILGAQRASGEPIRATIDAASLDEAREYAAREGILVSRINELEPEPVSELLPDDDAPKPDWENGPMTIIRFGSRHVPDLDPLPGETIRAELLARGWQIGISGVLFGIRRRLVLTSHRLIALDRQLMGASIETARLEHIAGVRIGTQTNTTLRVMGYLTVASSLLWLGWSIMQVTQAAGTLGGGLGGALGGQVTQMVQSARAAEQVLAASSALIGLVMIYASRQRVIGALAHSVFCGIRVRRLDPRHSRAFINDLESAIEAVSSKNPH